MTLQSLHLQTNRDGVLPRRSFLSRVALGTAGYSTLGWLNAVGLRAEELRQRGLACILLFMRGGPSQFETFDPKPGTTSGGPTRTIATAVPDLQIAEHWPRLARQMKDIALVRSLTNSEGEHQRARYQLHTGYAPTGGVKHPTFGSIASVERGADDFDLPHFVSIGNSTDMNGPGFLGTAHAPFVISDPAQRPANVELPRNVIEARLRRRLDLLQDNDQDLARVGGTPQIAEKQALYANAARMVLSPRLQAFDLQQEKDAVRESYGRSAFGQGCLLARRLVETGVTFVEVESNGWDTHKDNFSISKKLSASVDGAFAALVSDLKARGLLDKTLVVWMGEFGRSPRINPDAGRDHYPRAFSVALAGAGIQGGQVVGTTTADGSEVKERPVRVADLFCTFCHSLRINPRKSHLSEAQRPIKIVEGGTVIHELFR